MPALWQLEHGWRLSHRTLRLRHVVHDRGFKVGLVGLALDAEVGEVRLLLGLVVVGERLLELSNWRGGGGREMTELGGKSRGSKPKFLTYCSEEKVLEKVSMFALKAASESMLLPTMFYLRLGTDIDDMYEELLPKVRIREGRCKMRRAPPNPCFPFFQFGSSCYPLDDSNLRHTLSGF